MLSSSTLAILGATVITESVLYGILLVCFFIGLYLRYVGQPKHYRFWRHPVVISSTAIFLACTVHWILIVANFLDNYAVTPNVALTLQGPTTQEVANVFVLVTLTVGDAVIIHRLWVIWNHKISIIVLPVLSLLGLIATGIVGVSATFFIKIPRGLEKTITAYWIYVIITNLYCTAFIAWRIWNARRPSQTGSAEAKPLMVVLAVIIESAAMQAIWTLFFAITNYTGSKFLMLAVNLTPQIIGLSNILVVVQLATTHRSAPSPSGVVMTSPASMFGVAVSLPTTTNEYTNATAYNAYNNTSPRTASKDLTIEP